MYVRSSLDLKLFLRFRYIVGSRPGQGQGLCKDNEISIWCLFVKHAALRSKNKDCINIISYCGLLFCSANTVKPQAKCVGLVHTKY
jgi:hypothetical protein